MVAAPEMHISCHGTLPVLDSPGQVALWYPLAEVQLSRATGAQPQSKNTGCQREPTVHAQLSGYFLPHGNADFLPALTAP